MCHPAQMALMPDQLRAGEIELCRWNADHVDETMAAVESSYPELHRWMTWAQTMPTREVMSAVIADGAASFEADREWQYVLREVATGELVGGAGLHRRVGPDGLEIGYWVRTDRTGHGYATSSARALTDAAFASPLGFERVEIHMDQANSASVAVPRKLGFRLVLEEDREILAPGHTGRGFIWTVERSSWLQQS
jgi:RimJ/RimL family protein N-acetyltransferase